MDFYNDALKEAEKQNIKLDNECKELFLLISLQIQNMSSENKSNYLKQILNVMKESWK